MRILTETEKKNYTLTSGIRCPTSECSGKTRMVGKPYTDETGVYQGCECDECEYTWEEVYRLADVSDLRTP